MENNNVKIVLLDAASLGEDIDLSPLQGFAGFVSYDRTSQAQWEERVRDAHILISNNIFYTPGKLACARNLKLICVTSTGYDNVDISWCKSHGIAVCNVPSYSGDSVAQYTVAMALALSCRLLTYREYVHSGVYSKGTTPNFVAPVWHELRDKTWGIVGCGDIGRRVARIANSLGCQVLVYRRSPDPEYETVDIMTLARRADILSIHLPLNKETKGLLSREVIAGIKPGAIVINVARGAVVDERALTESMVQGHIAGLGIDAYSSEPLPPDSPYMQLTDHPNVILTPHSAWSSQEARNRCISVVGENIRAFLAGEHKNRIC